MYVGTALLAVVYASREAPWGLRNILVYVLLGKCIAVRIFLGFSSIVELLGFSVGVSSA